MADDALATQSDLLRGALEQTYLEVSEVADRIILLLDEGGPVVPDTVPGLEGSTSEAAKTALHIALYAIACTKETLIKGIVDHICNELRDPDDIEYYMKMMRSLDKGRLQSATPNPVDRGYPKAKGDGIQDSPTLTDICVAEWIKVLDISPVNQIADVAAVLGLLERHATKRIDDTQFLNRLRGEISASSPEELEAAILELANRGISVFQFLRNAVDPYIRDATGNILSSALNGFFLAITKSSDFFPIEE